MSDSRHSLLLVGEDSIQITWAERLEREGYNVEILAEGRRALDRLEEVAVDLVLLDAHLPDAEGLTFLRKLRRRFAADQLQVIMVTDGQESEDIVKAFDLGANDYVSKPLDFEVLLVRIRARLRGRTPVVDEPSDAVPTLHMTDIEPGAVIDGKYELETMIGRGHYGMVYRARHLKLRRPVAVKFLHPNYQNRDESLMRFHREGMAACQVEHPNAVSVLDYSVTQGGMPYLVMEFLQGHSLEVEIKRAGSLSPMRVAVILLPICEVLSEVHALGILHRDIKPQNIFLQQTRRGEVVKVLDFGIAKLVDDAILGQELTVEGSGPGTPTYMAPERFAEQPYDGRADVYSLGVMLYEMLTGQPPFNTASGNPIKMALMHMSQKPTSLCELNPELPGPLEEVVMRALNKDPEQRPTAAMLAQDFVQALGLELPEQFMRSFGVDLI